MGRSTPRLKSRMRKTQPRGSVFDLASFDSFVECSRHPPGPGPLAQVIKPSARVTSRDARRAHHAQPLHLQRTPPQAAHARESILFVTIESSADPVNSDPIGPQAQLAGARRMRAAISSRSAWSSWSKTSSS
jgi:hypothetical protein